MEKFSVLQEKEYATRQLKMKRIQEGGGYHQWHYESMGSDPSVKLLCSYISNTISDGGETEFYIKRSV